MRSSSAWAGALCVASMLVSTGCGGGERQDANEKSGSFDVSIVDATFPLKQTLAKQSELQITVKNAGQSELPMLAVTVGDEKGNGFTRRSSQPGLADPERPVWIVDKGPSGGDTAYVGTWALGPVGAGQTKTFTWKLTAVVPGQHTVKYRVAAGLDGKAKAQLPSGGVPQGSFDVNISDKPAQSKVDPDTGKVIRVDPNSDADAG